MNEKLDEKNDFKTLHKRKTSLVYNFILVYIVFLFAAGFTQMTLGYSDTVAFIIFVIVCLILVVYFGTKRQKIENLIALKLLNDLELAEFMDFMHEQHKNKKLTRNSTYYNYMALMYNNKLDNIYKVLVLKEPADNFKEELNDNIVECSKVFNYYFYLCNEVLKENKEEANKYIDLLLKYNENYYVVRKAREIRDKN